MLHDPTKPAARRKVDNEALVQKHLATLPRYERDCIFPRELHIVDDGNECDDTLRNLCVLRQVRNCLLTTTNNVQATDYCL